MPLLGKESWGLCDQDHVLGRQKPGKEVENPSLAAVVRK